MYCVLMPRFSIDFFGGEFISTTLTVVFKYSGSRIYYMVKLMEHFIALFRNFLNRDCSPLPIHSLKNAQVVRLEDAERKRRRTRLRHIDLRLTSRVR